MMNFRLDYSKDTKKENNFISIMNKNIAVTGTIPKKTRMDIVQSIYNGGGIYHNNVSNKIDFLISGNTKITNAKKYVSIKTQLATELNIPIISYTQIKELQ